MAPEDAPWSIAAGELRDMRQLLQLQADSTACITSLDSFVGNNLTGPWLAGVNTGVVVPTSACLTSCHLAERPLTPRCLSPRQCCKSCCTRLHCRSSQACCTAVLVTLLP